MDLKEVSTGPVWDTFLNIWQHFHISCATYNPPPAPPPASHLNSWDRDADTQVRQEDLVLPFSSFTFSIATIFRASQCCLLYLYLKEKDSLICFFLKVVHFFFFIALSSVIFIITLGFFVVAAYLYCFFSWLQPK